MGAWCLCDTRKSRTASWEDQPLEQLSPTSPWYVPVSCYSLSHYSKIKDASIENLLPHFDFDHTIGSKLVSIGETCSVVDAFEFDGPFHNKVANLVSSMTRILLLEKRRGWAIYKDHVGGD
ncbi:hypothetical protein SAY87_028787 [Trapa incisa]|uniref:Uncharacterized protein n=1 Tax=Trapa incisa TaxID=236973 RepID=A0AAN7L0F1_9MYRT|nr:hypothetical protein SAY87_028787 [Trapa incisa]